MTTPQIIITAPARTDVDSQTSTGRHPPRLWIAGVQIITPWQTLKEATQSLEFLQTLEELVRRHREQMNRQLQALRHQQILDEPETATEEEFEAAIAREGAEPPRYMVFYHAPGGPDAARTVWSWDSDIITHYSAAGEETGSLIVEPTTAVIAAIRASAFGPIVSHEGRNNPDDGTQHAPA